MIQSTCSLLFKDVTYPSSMCRVSPIMEKTATKRFSNICVFAGSNLGKNEEFAKAAKNLGQVLAERRIHLVYGGGTLGLMGCVSKAAHAGGSQVLGVIPRALFTDGALKETIGEVEVVASMHDRKAAMFKNSDAFIALPGGFGTLEEIFEVTSWAQLNIHQKPIGLLNVDGFYDTLLSFLDQAVEQNFISPVVRRILISAPTPLQLIEQLEAFVPEYDHTMPKLVWSAESSRKRPKVDTSLHL